MSPIFKRFGRRGRGTVPPPGVLRRERRALIELREQRLRDLGGLLLEMFRRNRFREDLVRERCEELVDIDEHLASLDALLGVSWTAPETARCACGARLAEEARFCPVCGRSVGEAARTCARCGHALQADAVYCVRCGEAAGPRSARDPQPVAELPPDDAQPAVEAADG